MIENNINTWAESISALPDKQFFNAIRLFIGEVKTPYNKQKLTSQLASILKTPENINSVLNLLDELDINLLTAIYLIPNANQTIITEFFSGTYTFSQIFPRLINLTERLVIYTAKDPISEKTALKINPLFEEQIKQFFSTKSILPVFEVVQYSTEDIFCLSANFLTAFVSYLKMKGCSCKADGTIKKNDMNKVAEIFPGKENCIQLLVSAFINLSLVREGDKTLEIDNSRLSVFSKLPEIYQYAFLCAAATSRFSREGLRKEAQLLLDCISSIPEYGYTRNTILRLAFLVGTYSEDGKAVAKKSRFTQMLEAAKADNSEDVLQNANILDRMIDSAIEFGLLQKKGCAENGEEIFVKGTIFQNQPSYVSIEGLPKVLNIESTFSVTLMPGLPFSETLPLTNFLYIKKTGIVTEYEISRSGMSVAFDNGWTPETIFSELEKHTYYEIPQNLKINITEWYSSYSSAVLYHGFILKVTESNIQMVENNPKIKNFIKEKLAEGIYLLNVPVNSDISVFISECGLDFMGNVKKSVPENESSSFPLLNSGKKLSISSIAESALRTVDQNASEDLLNSLKTAVEQMDLNQNQKESFMNRISLKLILSKNQLNTASIKSEILEADGMDFTGKVHLLEASAKEEDLVEIQLPSPNGNGKYFTIIGKVLQLSKQTSEAVIRFQLEPSKEINNFLVSKITHIRRLRY